ncbi:elastin-like isoform X4 [Phycodurus eques]|uniref:elastin-like isoform X4 n=1 Tax=Phycodurus eques TaxID=693459 RepID=UPI002ACDF072|nr:elastin-like isoform X4 [Phycodurus eques]
MKIPGTGYNAGLGALAGSNTKGYGAGVPNRFGAKPGYGTGGHTVPINGYRAGLGYPNAGKPQQPIYSQGANLAAAGYVKGNSYPDLGHGVPTMNAKSGGGLQVPYNGAPAVPAALDGVGRPEQQPAGLGPNGIKGPVYGGMVGLLYGGPTGMGPEKSNAKYGIGGLQFGGSPQTGTNGVGNYGYGVYEPTADLKSGKYGGTNTGGGVPGQYGYGGLPNIGHLLGRGSNGHMAGKYVFPVQVMAECPMKFNLLDLSPNSNILVLAKTVLEPRHISQALLDLDQMSTMVVVTLPMGHKAWWVTESLLGKMWITRDSTRANLLNLLLKGDQWEVIQLCHEQSMARAWRIINMKMWVT